MTQDGFNDAEGEEMSNDLMQDGPGCAETRRYALWFATRMDAMWLARRAFWAAIGEAKP